MNKAEWIERNKKYTLTCPESGFTINFAGMKFEDTALDTLKPQFDRAVREMKNLESGAIKNPDENRQVTHFTDRIDYAKSELFKEVESFAAALRSGAIKGSTGKNFEYAIINGIGGSALGPQLMQFAINGPYWNELSESKRDNWLKIYFLDNTDTAGAYDVLQVVDLEKTLVASISKSGGTQETKNNMIAMESAYKKAGLDFARHACVITMANSQLDKLARGANWLKVMEMAESIGGRTSETSIVGHLPAALTGIDFASFLAGACHMDEWTRNESYCCNPAYMLAAMWYIAGQGKGDRNMVIVPYADRLVLLSRYFQQLVMESLGKELDLDGKAVYQGLNVFGNKGGTDAHAFIQQLNDGRDDFFVTFIEVMEDAAGMPIEGRISMGDFLHGFEAGLSAALRGKGRQVIEMSIKKVDEFNLGMIIALYERAVAVYAEFINVNAFHQPGVQAYKLASKDIIDLLNKIEAKLPEMAGFEGGAADFATKIACPDDQIEVGGILAKLADNNDKRELGVQLSRRWENGKGWIFTVK
jgi:glucose-6-phosphate isomerase